MVKILDPIFDFVQDHLLLALSPLFVFVIIVVPAVLILQARYDQKRITDALARKLRPLGLEPDSRGLSSRDLRLVFQWSRLQSADILHVQYVVSLPRECRRLSLSREGYKSGLAARKGDKELITDDLDFDDYFWIPSASLEFLTPERRALLLEIFPKLSADAEIVDGRLSGRVRCEQSPFGVNAVVRMMQDVEHLRSQILDPPVVDATSSQGWVRRGKCRRASIPLWLVGLPLLLISGWMLLNQVGPLGVTMGVMVSGIIVSSTAMALWAGRRSALPLARSVQFLASLAILSTAPLWLQAATPTGVVIAAALALGAIYGLHLGYAYLTRLRLL